MEQGKCLAIAVLSPEEQVFGENLASTALYECFFATGGRRILGLGSENYEGIASRIPMYEE